MADLPFLRRIAALAAITTALLLAACSPSGKEQAAPAAPPPAVQAPAPAPTAPARGIELPSFVKLVKQAGPTVVNIGAIQKGKASGLRRGDPLYEFFRRFGGVPDTGESPTLSLGSGFIISQDGYILTNAHVIDQADEVIVKLTDKREFKAKVIGADVYTDVALIKINANALPVVKIGDPSKVDPGEWVAAIGAPFGFENSVTVGVVSAKGRLLPNGSFVPFIQTDVAVNPGNSGGPLFSTNGEVIGINSQIYSETGGYMGISFAIPIDIAVGIAKQLRETGKVVRGYLGVQLQELTQDIASSLGLKDTNGALISAVQRGGPADKAGIKPGDVVVAFNGQPVQTTADFARLVGETKPGTSVSMDVLRGGKKETVKVTPGVLKG
ncbi:MAG TPA: Do family serine endopeptidase [Noviherbaspirillum sp.]|uniref:Do family serine endopeptidase n=1 Tax=Noviherbaspirillum sp. TaxID=1926288 RepID=UPI002B45D88C|nr:Do family serine endopeptidase [Noviherbaspirillum sp.]HJV87540.1 Do family serine endopeptidase [Noviherbaspirillum sp.]